MTGRRMLPLAAWCAVATAAGPVCAGPAEISAAEAAEQAAVAAEAAAEAAATAMEAARAAARRARAAAAAARTAAGGSPLVTAEAPSAPQLNVAPPLEDENLAVTRPADAMHSAQEGRQKAKVFAGLLPATVLNGPNEATVKSSTIPDFQFLVTEKEKVISLAWTFDLSSGSRNGTLYSDQITFTGSGAFDGKSDTELAALKGFPSGATLEAVWSHYTTGINLTGKEKSQVATARANCLAKPGAKIADCDPYAYNDGGVGAFVDKYNGDLKSLLDEVMGGPVEFYGLKFAGNQASYKYLDRTAFSTKKNDHFSYSASAYWGVMFDSGRTSVLGSYTHGRRYKEMDPVNICQPLPGTVQTQCLNSADGAPSRQKPSVLSFEVRHIWPGLAGSIGSLAVAPEFSSDLKKQSYAVSFPIYLAGDGVGKLRGGIRGTYLNEEDKKNGGRDESYGVGVFVGVPFSVLGP